MIREATPTTIRSSLGDSVTFTCTVDALPSPYITWRRNGTIISTAGSNSRWQLSKNIIESDISGAVRVTSNLTLMEVRITDDNSQIECTATNEYGEASIQYIIGLEGVIGKPHIYVLVL